MIFSPVCSLLAKGCCLWGCGSTAACTCCGGSCGPIKGRVASCCCDGSWGPIGAADDRELVASVWGVKRVFGSDENAVKGWDASLAWGLGSRLVLEDWSKNKILMYKDNFIKQKHI